MADVVTITVDVSQRPAERLRFKGQQVHITRFDKTERFRVTRVSMPDASGCCEITAAR